MKFYIGSGLKNWELVNYYSKILIENGGYIHSTGQSISIMIWLLQNWENIQDSNLSLEESVVMKYADGTEVTCTINGKTESSVKDEIGDICWIDFYEYTNIDDVKSLIVNGNEYFTEWKNMNDVKYCESIPILDNRKVHKKFWNNGKSTKKALHWISDNVMLLNVIKYYALSTKPDLKQAVHTYILRLAPLASLTLTDLTFDFHILLDLLWEWLTPFPKWTPFSQIAHLAIIAPP